VRLKNLDRNKSAGPDHTREARWQRDKVRQSRHRGQVYSKLTFGIKFIILFTYYFDERAEYLNKKTSRGRFKTFTETESSYRLEYLYSSINCLALKLSYRIGIVQISSSLSEIQRKKRGDSCICVCVFFFFFKVLLISIQGHRKARSIRRPVRNRKISISQMFNLLICVL